ncbi:MAG: DNA repair protein RecN [Burkholderiales bacterium]|nr:DNA repair protein RecN [Burkholderiales bacterium]
MLLALSLQDFVIADRVRLEFARGFSVLTGETGAGKSMLVDALTLVLGGRADSAAVRTGRERAEVSAEFDASKLASLQAWLTENDLAGEEGECILRRVIDAGGRSRAYINGRPCTAAQLREAGEQLVDIHGQHEYQSLVRSASQRRLLDGYAGATETAAEVEHLHRRWQELADTRARALESAQALADERERLEWQVQELKQLAITEQEWDELQTDHGRLAHAAALIEGVETSLDALSEGENACVAAVSGVVSRLQQLATHDPALKEVLDVLEPAEIQLQEAGYALRHYRQRLDLDPDRLREVEARLEAVVGMARKYRVPPRELPGKQKELAARLGTIAAGMDAEALAREEAAAREACVTVGRKLSKMRAKAAAELASQVTAAMQQLAMAGGRFEVALTPLDEPSAGGMEQIEFLVTAHAGGTPRPIAKVASGGELSRLSLALQTVASKVADVPTLVFDEVDAGIGGGVAEIVGRMLRALGRSRQVLCITHLPQVAAAADNQWRVAKRAVKGETLSSVDPLEGDARVDEIARMLGGVKITDTTRRHAAEMLGTTGR